MYFSRVLMLTFAFKWLSLSQLKRACADLRSLWIQWYRLSLPAQVKMSHPSRTLSALVNLLHYQLCNHHSNQRLFQLLQDKTWQLCSGYWSKFTGGQIASQKLKVSVNSCSRKINLQSHQSKRRAVHWLVIEMVGRLVRMMLRVVLSKPSNLSLTKRVTKEALVSWKLSSWCVNRSMISSQAAQTRPLTKISLRLLSPSYAKLVNCLTLIICRNDTLSSFLH